MYTPVRNLPKKTRNTAGSKISERGRFSQLEKVLLLGGGDRTSMSSGSSSAPIIGSSSSLGILWFSKGRGDRSNYRVDKGINDSFSQAIYRSGNWVKHLCAPNSSDRLTGGSSWNRRRKQTKRAIANLSKPKRSLRPICARTLERLPLEKPHIATHNSNSIYAQRYWMLNVFTLYCHTANS